MKKTILFILVSLIIVCIFTSCSAQQKEETENSSISSTKTETNLTKADKKPTETQTQTETKKETAPEKETEKNTEPVLDNTELNMKNALFIGDSRTVGLMEYSGLSSDFFANVGMSVYNIYEKKVSVPGTGKISLNDLLSRKKYNTIYLMLGINELGYNINNTVSEYKKLVSFIKEKQPEAILFIQKNLHITKSKSDSEKYINNENINLLNSKIAEIANHRDIFCIDANSLFDNAQGALDADKTSDNVHLYARYYSEWGKWITEESKKNWGDK